MIQGTVTEQDYVAAQWLHLRPRPFLSIVGCLLLILAIWAAYVGKSITIVAVLTYLLLYFLILLPWKSRRAFRQYKALSERLTVEVREDGIFLKREHGEGLVPWSHIVKWKTNSKLTVIYPSTNIFYLLPRHLFGSEGAYKEFLSLLGTQVGKAAG